MNTIKCRIKVNEYQDIPGIGITPAEAVVLRHIHDPSAATHSKSATGDERKNFWKFITNAAPSGVAMTEAATEDGKPHERTAAEEVARLRRKYLMRAKSGAQGSHVLDDIYPGENPKLPETFEEIGMEVEAPEEKPARKKKADQPE